MGLLISPKWSYQVLFLEHLTRSALELHAVSVTLPIKLDIAAIYRPPGPLGDNFNEMDALLSRFPENGTALVVLGDFNIQPEKLQSPEFRNLFATFSLTLTPSLSTHRTGNQLDLVFTRSLLHISLCLTTILSLSSSP